MDASILGTKSATEISFSVTNSATTTRTTKSPSPFEFVETNGLLKFGYFNTLYISSPHEGATYQCVGGDTQLNKSEVECNYDVAKQYRWMSHGVISVEQLICFVEHRGTVLFDSLIFQ
jgi:hypothetical protein